LVTVSGEDKPGVSASLLAILAEHKATILDMGQAVIHQTLSLGLLVQVPQDDDWPTVAKELLFRAYELGLTVKFEAIEPETYNRWVGAQGKERHIVTLLGKRLDAEPLARFTRIICDHGLNIDVINRLSGRVPLDNASAPAMACIELSVRGTPRDSTEMRRQFLDLAHEAGVDIAFQVDNVYRRNRRLVAFDMDSTLIQAEVIDELAKAAGTGEEVARITELAMHGEIDYQESFRQRLSLLKGLDEKSVAEVADRIPLTEGAERLITMLKRLGYKVALLSGGFTYFGERLRKRLGIDYLHANELEMLDGVVTGNVSGPIVDGPRKAELLHEIAAKENISLEQVIAIGDGANDLPMLSAAGLGIAFRAKPIVAKSARQAISTVGLDGILYLIGVRDRDTLDEFNRM
jgi:phosphoserine phosphatase